MPDALSSAPNPHLAPYTVRGLKGRILSGVQPTGNLHLGNYLGAIRNFARLQNDYDCIYCVVDQHAITLWQDPKELSAQTREIASAFLAAGVDGKREGDNLTEQGYDLDKLPYVVQYNKRDLPSVVPVEELTEVVLRFEGADDDGTIGDGFGWCNVHRSR